MYKKFHTPAKGPLLEVFSMDSFVRFL